MLANLRFNRKNTQNATRSVDTKTVVDQPVSKPTGRRSLMQLTLPAELSPVSQCHQATEASGAAARIADVQVPPRRCKTPEQIPVTKPPNVGRSTSLNLTRPASRLVSKLRRAVTCSTSKPSTTNLRKKSDKRSPLDSSDESDDDDDNDSDVNSESLLCMMQVPDMQRYSQLPLMALSQVDLEC